MGAANAAAGVTQGFSVGASGSRTAVNDGMGARSQIAGLIAAATVLVILLFLTEPVQYLPKAVLGAVIVSAAIGLIEPLAWRALAAVDPVEVAIAAVTTGCVVVFGVLEALAVAVGLSVIDTVRRSARPARRRAGLGRPARTLRRRLAAPDGDGDARRRRLPARRPSLLRQRPLLQRRACARRSAPRRHRCPGSCFDAEAVTHADSTGLEALEKLTEDLRAGGDHARRRATQDAHGGRSFEQAGVTETIGRDRFYPSVHAAVDAYVSAHETTA